MPNSNTVTFRNVEYTEWIDNLIKEQIEKLSRQHQSLLSCRATLNVPHHHHHKGYRYQLSLELHVAGKSFVVGDHCERDPSHEDIHLAIKDTFQAAHRQLERRTGT